MLGCVGSESVMQILTTGYVSEGLSAGGTDLSPYSNGVICVIIMRIRHMSCTLRGV